MHTQYAGSLFFIYHMYMYTSQFENATLAVIGDRWFLLVLLKDT